MACLSAAYEHGEGRGSSGRCISGETLQYGKVSISCIRARRRQGAIHAVGMLQAPGSRLYPESWTQADEPAGMNLQDGKVVVHAVSLQAVHHPSGQVLLILIVLRPSAVISSVSEQASPHACKPALGIIGSCLQAPG